MPCREVRASAPRINSTDGPLAPQNTGQPGQRLRDPFFLIGTCSTVVTDAPVPGSASTVPGSTCPVSAIPPTWPLAAGSSASTSPGDVAVSESPAGAAVGGPAGRLALRRRVRVTTLGL